MFERRNNGLIVKIIDKIIVMENRRRGKPKRKWIGVLGEVYEGEFGVNKNVVSDRERTRK